MSAIDVLTRPLQSAGGIDLLLAWEAEIRRQPTVAELGYFLANDIGAIAACEQAFVLSRPLIGDGWWVQAASGVVAVDRNAPLIRAVEAAARRLDRAAAVEAPLDEALADYPFHEWLWQPLDDRDGAAFAGLLLARAHPFDDRDASRVERIGETAAHAWLALTGGKPAKRLPKLTKRQRRIALAVAAGAALFPVHLSVLAPVEVVAARPAIITAPVAGVVTAVDVAPGQAVTKDQTLLRFDDVKLRNDATLAAQRLQVARAKVDEVSSATFADAAQGRGISIAQAEYQLAAADYGYARDLLARARVTAPATGIAIFTDRRDLEGRAVDVGQPLMEIADPARVRYRIELPTREQISLKPGSSVSVWLDSQPLWSQAATLVEASYQAKPTVDGILAFALDAVPGDGAAPRIGSRGTARVRGPWVPLGYAVLRRPIASLRQVVGL